MLDLKAERSNTIAHADSIVNRAKAAGRDLTSTEAASVEAAITRIEELDKQLKGRSLAESVLRLGNADEPNPETGIADATRYLTLRSPGVKSDLAKLFGHKLGTTGMKALLDPANPYTSVPMDATVYRQGDAPPALSEIIPAINRPVSFRYMRQTSRTNNAAPVASGALKPTSVYGLTSVEGRLHVIAHVSEPIDKYQLQDGPSLAQFVQEEMVAGLHQALETQIVSGDGLGENLTGLANTSGIQVQAYTSSPVLTARAAVTKVQVLSFEPYYFVLAPSDWEAIETSTLSAGQYVLNAEGTRNGVPVDSAARRLWGVPVTVSTAVPAGVGYLLSNGVAQLATDGRIETEQSNAHADDFSRNNVRLRVESRFDLVVTRPMGVVQLDLTAL